MSAPPPAPRRGLRVPLAVARHVGGMPREFWWLWVGSLVNRMGTFVVPFLALYVTRGRGLSEATAGAVLLAWGVALLPAQPLGGQLADRVGRIPTLLIATVGSAAAMVALGFASTPATLVVSAAALGLFGESYRPAVSALLADIVPVEDRPRAFGLQFWAINLGFAAAASVGGLLAERSWLLLFLGDAVTTLTFGLLIAWRVREPARPAVASDGGFLASARVVATDRLFLAIMALTVLYGAMYAQSQSTLPVQIVADGLTEADYGTIIALNGLVIVLVQPWVIGRVSRWRPGIALAAGGLIVGTGLWSTVLATTWTTYAITVVVWTLGEIIAATFSAPVVADISPPHMRGRYQGWFGFAFSIAFAFAPAIGLATFGRFGGAVVWIACLVGGLALAGGWLAVRHPLAERRAAAAAHSMDG